MKLKDIDTSRFVFDPKSPDFEDRLLKYDEFKNLKVIGLKNKQVLSWLSLMYETKSSLRHEIQSLPTRKFEAAEACDFPIDEGKMSDPILEFLVLEKQEYRDAAIKYTSLLGNPDFIALATYQFIYEDGLKKRDFSKQSIDNLEKLRLLIKELTDSILGGDDIADMKRAIYSKAGSLQLDIKPEDIAKKLEDGKIVVDVEPYGKGYMPEKVKFKKAK